MKVGLGREERNKANHSFHQQTTPGSRADSVIGLGGGGGGGGGGAKGETMD